MKNVLITVLILLFSIKSYGQILKYEKTDIQFGSNHEFDWADRNSVHSGYSVSRRIAANVYFETPINKVKTSFGLGYGYVQFEGIVNNKYSENLSSYDNIHSFYEESVLWCEFDGLTIPITVSYDFIENVELFVEYSFTYYDDIILEKAHIGSVINKLDDNLYTYNSDLHNLFMADENYLRNVNDVISNNWKIGLKVNYKRVDLSFSCVGNLSNSLNNESYHIEVFNPTSPKTEVTRYNMRSNYGGLGYNVALGIYIF